MIQTVKKITKKKIRVKFSSQRSLVNMLRRLKDSGQKFHTEDTSGSFKIIQENKIYEYNSPGDLTAMGVYMKLRKEILGRQIHNQIYNPKKLREYSPRDLKYWKIAPRSDGGGNGTNKKWSGDLGEKQVIRKVTNIDISKAYPFAFFRLGFISRDVLKYLLELDRTGNKISRLKGMGILAKQKVVNKYGSGRLLKSEIRKDDYLRACFFNACKVIDDIMLKCVKLCGREFLFFWVDGIYVDTGSASGRKVAKRVCDYIKKCGYKYSREILRDFNYEVVDNTQTRKRVLNIKFRKKNSRGKYGRKPKSFSLPLNVGLEERLW